MSLRIDRRTVLAGLGASLAAHPVRAESVAPRGAIDATQEGIVPGSREAKRGVWRAVMERAAAAGRPLFLPPGRYPVADLVVPPDTHIIGVPRQTRIVYAGGDFLLRAENATRFRIEGVVVDGAGLPLHPDAHGLVHCEEVGEAVAEDCEVVGSTAAGLSFRNSAGRIERCRVSSARTIGIHVSHSRGMAVTDNVVADCGDTGIMVHRYEEGPDDTIVRGNRVSGIKALSGGSGQHGNGINLVKANGVIVADNRVDGCALSAIRCFSSDNVQVSGNIATGSGETAIYVEFAHAGAVVSGNLVDGAAYGISFANLDHGGRLSVCSGNLVRNIRGGRPWPDSPPEFGAGIGAEADISITANVIENALQGLQLGWGIHLRDVLATGNVIRKCGVGVAVTVVEDTGPAVIADNLISGSERGAILGMRWRETVTGDLALAGAEAFPNLSIERNRVS